MRQKMVRQFCQMESLNTTSQNASSLDLWRIEEASISHLVCLLCISEVFGRTFLKEMSCHSPCQGSRGPPAQGGSLEDPWSFLGVR